MNKVFKRITGSIRIKLILCFLVPVLIIILGISAYMNSSKAIINTLQMQQYHQLKNWKYYELILENAEDKVLISSRHSYT